MAQIGTGCRRLAGVLSLVAVAEVVGNVVRVGCDHFRRVDLAFELVFRHEAEL
jgi:hypothetical protein